MYRTFSNDVDGLSTEAQRLLAASIVEQVMDAGFDRQTAAAIAHAVIARGARRRPSSSMRAKGRSYTMSAYGRVLAADGDRLRGESVMMRRLPPKETETG